MDWPTWSCSHGNILGAIMNSILFLECCFLDTFKRRMMRKLLSSCLFTILLLISVYILNVAPCACWPGCCQSFLRLLDSILNIVNQGWTKEDIFLGRLKLISPIILMSSIQRGHSFQVFHRHRVHKWLAIGRRQRNFEDLMVNLGGFGVIFMSTPAGPIFTFGALLDHSFHHKGLRDAHLKIPTRSFSP